MDSDSPYTWLNHAIQTVFALLVLPGTERLALLYPQAGQDSTISCWTHPVSTNHSPSHEAVYCSQRSSRCRQKILLNGPLIDVPDDVFRMLSSLRQNSTAIRVIWLHTLCINQPGNPSASDMYAILRTHSELSMNASARRAVVYLGFSSEGEQELQAPNDLDSSFEKSPSFVPASVSKHGGNHLLKDLLTALESFRSSHKMVDALERTGLVFLYDSQELSLDGIRELSDRYESAADIVESSALSPAPATRGSHRPPLHGVVSGHHVHYQPPREPMFPKTRAFVDLVYAKRKRTTTRSYVTGPPDSFKAISRRQEARQYLDEDISL